VQIPKDPEQTPRLRLCRGDTGTLDKIAKAPYLYNQSGQIQKAASGSSNSANLFLLLRLFFERLQFPGQLLGLFS
jgi:hypothetical protein